MIDFQCENVEMPQFDVARVSRWIEAVATDFSKRVGAVNYIFCDDDYILDANNKYLGHDYFTDVITFDYSHGDKVSGDILISLDTVRTNADKFGQEYMTEFYRVLIHGILHLCGVGDKLPGEREKMEACENKALSMLEQL